MGSSLMVLDDRLIQLFCRHNHPYQEGDIIMAWAVFFPIFFNLEAEVESGTLTLGLFPISFFLS